ncbi:hypothetical protein [Streptomyces harbinensis]|uniref:hypothetical protein n=1 Tax=Streptomyces harbinensis TaxID=1176198 RepID=UPI0036757803
MKALAPYPVLAGEVSFRVTAARLDGRALDLDMISPQDRVVALHQVQRSEWDEARLELRATLPDAELANARWREVTCAAVLTEGATNCRRVAALRRTASGHWSGTITMRRDSHRARAELSVMVAAEVDDVPGRVVGRSDEDWIVDLRARTPVRQRELDINEIDFRDGPQDWLRPYKDLPWLVDTSGEMPTVHLNTAVEGVTELLGSGGTAVDRSMRDMLAAQIAADAWSVMFHSAVSELELDEDGTPQWPSGWRDWVLRTMLPDVLPESSSSDALWEIHHRRSEGTGWNELHPRIQYAASRRARVSRNLGMAFRVLNRSVGRDPS